MHWLIRRGELTEEQLRVIELAMDCHLLVLGPPGSGKTLVLLYRAQHLLEQHRIPDANYRVFVFTNVLKDYIRSASDLLGLSSSNILTFDDWCRIYFEENIGRPPWTRRGPNFVGIRQGVLNHLRRIEDPRLFDFVLVDEGQDLDETCYQIIRLVSNHTTVFGDDNQQVYKHGIGIDKVRKLLGVDQEIKTVQILNAFHCNPGVARLAASFVRSGDETYRCLDKNPPTLERESQKPLLVVARDSEDETSKLIENVRARLDLDESIGILFPSRKHLFGYSKRLREEGLEVEVPPRPGRNTGSKYPTIDFSSSNPKAMVYPSAKGLTFDAVFLPCFDREKFPFLFSNDQLRKWIFVGISRTIHWVYISSVENRVLFYDELRQLEYENRLAVQRHWFEENKDEEEIPRASVKSFTGFERP